MLNTLLPLAAVAADPLKMLLRPPSLWRLLITSTGPAYFLGPPALDWTCKQYEVSISSSVFCPVSLSGRWLRMKRSCSVNKQWTWEWPGIEIKQQTSLLFVMCLFTVQQHNIYCLKMHKINDHFCDGPDFIIWSGNWFWGRGGQSPVTGLSPLTQPAGSQVEMFT